MRPLIRHLSLLAACACAHPALAQDAMCRQFDFDFPAPLEEVAADDQRLILNADQGVLSEGGMSALSGSVRLLQGGKEFLAPALDFDEVRRRIAVQQESLFRTRELIVKSQRVDFDLNSESGVFTNTSFTLPGRAARGDAGSISLSRDGTAEFRAVRYTTCAPGSRAWYLHARSILLDHDEGLGTARNARLTFLGVPILYLPYFRFPIDDRRRTGLLFPTLGQSEQTGFDLRWPLYLNLAPNYDATLTPRFMSKRGFQLGSDQRYLLARGEGHVRFDLLNHDNVTDTRRSYFQLDHTSLINQRLALEAHLAEASDRQYFEDLGGEVDVSSTNYLDRSVRLTYQAPSAYVITALAQDYQTISSSVLASDEPYRRLPQVQLRLRSKNSLYDTRIGATAEYTNFLRANDTQNPQGQRFIAQPYLLMEKDRGTWFATAEVSLNSTYYLLSDTAPGLPNSPSRTLPQASAGGGLRFERVTGGGKLQTLEPQVFYLYTPLREQSQLPLFDSGEPDFDFTQLFARNRFSGEDRIADANHLVIAATSRLLDPHDGVQQLSASIGQLFRLQTPRVRLPDSLNAPQEGATDFIASLDYRLSAIWAGGFSSQWSPEDRAFNRSSVSMRYRKDSRRFDLAYRYRRNLLEQADAAASLPLGASWRVTGRARYSLRDNTSLENLLGVEYSTCCWAVQTSYRRFIANTRGDYDSGVYLQLNLKGLAQLGSGYAGPETLDQAYESIPSR